MSPHLETKRKRWGRGSLAAGPDVGGADVDGAEATGAAGAPAEGGVGTAGVGWPCCAGSAGWSAGGDDGTGGGAEELAGDFAPFFFPGGPLSSDVIV